MTAIDATQVPTRNAAGACTTTRLLSSLSRQRLKPRRRAGAGSSSSMGGEAAYELKRKRRWWLRDIIQRTEEENPYMGDEHSSTTSLINYALMNCSGKFFMTATQSNDEAISELRWRRSSCTIISRQLNIVATRMKTTLPRGCCPCVGHAGRGERARQPSLSHAARSRANVYCCSSAATRQPCTYFQRIHGSDAAKITLEAIEQKKSEWLVADQLNHFQLDFLSALDEPRTIRLRFCDFWRYQRVRARVMKSAIWNRKLEAEQRGKQPHGSTFSGPERRSKTSAANWLGKPLTRWGGAQGWRTAAPIYG